MIGSGPPRGTVYLAWDPDDRFYWGYWDQAPDGPPSHLEQCPPSPDLSRVLAWGRERSQRVLIRPASDHARYYWAGLGEPVDEYAELPILIV